MLGDVAIVLLTLTCLASCLAALFFGAILRELRKVEYRSDKQHKEKYERGLRDKTPRE